LGAPRFWLRHSACGGHVHSSDNGQGVLLTYMGDVSSGIRYYPIRKDELGPLLEKLARE
jgi:hypothetical protein